MGVSIMLGYLPKMPIESKFVQKMDSIENEELRNTNKC